MSIDLPKTVSTFHSYEEAKPYMDELRHRGIVTELVDAGYGTGEFAVTLRLSPTVMQALELAEPASVSQVSMRHDPDIAPGTVELRYGDRVVGTIINLGEPS